MMLLPCRPAVDGCKVLTRGQPELAKEVAMGTKPPSAAQQFDLELGAFDPPR